LPELLLWLGLTAAIDVTMASGTGIFKESVVAYSESFERNNPDAFQASLGFFFLGGIAGLALSILFPNRLFPHVFLSGFGILAAPVAIGLAMHVWGHARRVRGLTTSRLATFYGGASMGLGVALVRYYFVR
jgi:hypothetical protein